MSFKTGRVMEIDGDSLIKIDPESNEVTSNGASKDNYSTTTLSSSGVIKNSPGTIYGIIGINNNANQQYLQIFESASVPADGTVPTLVFILEPLDNFSIDFGVYGFDLDAGISWSNSITLETKTIGLEDCWLNAIYK